MGKGRKQKPETLKVLQGTFRKDRANANAPRQADGLASAPSFCHTREQIEWFGIIKGRVAPLGLASETFTESMGLLAARMAEIDELERFLAENGRVYETRTQSGDTMYRPWPQVAMLNEARRHAQSLASEFGLTPASIAKVGQQKDSDSSGSAFSAGGF
jgi:hypothetical protein